MTDATQQNPGAARVAPPPPPRPRSAAELAAEYAKRKAAGASTSKPAAPVGAAPRGAAASKAVPPSRVPPPPPEKHPWERILHVGRVFHVTQTSHPSLKQWLMVPLQVMFINTKPTSILTGQRGMLVAVEASIALDRRLESNLFMLLPDDDEDTEIELDPAYEGWERYSFLNTVSRPNAVFAPYWNNYYSLSQLCPTFVPPPSPAYSYVAPTRTCVSGLGITGATIISGMFFGLGYALAYEDPWFGYYYSDRGLLFYPGFGYYDPLLYEANLLTGALVLTEAALIDGVVGLGIGIGLGLVAGLKIALFAEAWCDPEFGYAGPGLMFMEPGMFFYGNPGLDWYSYGGYGGYVGAGGSFAVFRDGEIIPGPGYEYVAPYYDADILPDPVVAYGDFGGDNSGVFDQGFDQNAGQDRDFGGGDSQGFDQNAGQDADFGGGDTGDDGFFNQQPDRDFGGGDGADFGDDQDFGGGDGADFGDDQDFGGGDDFS